VTLTTNLLLEPRLSVGKAVPEVPPLCAGLACNGAAFTFCLKTLYSFLFHYDDIHLL
jgi:hypothetical protein